MSLWRKLRYLAPWIRRAEDRDIDEELASLREIAGPTELGNLTLAAEDARGALSWMWLERLRQDIRYAFRSMAHQKGFTLLVVISLALGIGATTAIYSFMESIMLRSLPVRDPHALVIMKWRAKTYTLAKTGMMWSTGGSSFDDSTTLSSIFPYTALEVFEDADEVVASAFCYFSVNRHAVTIADETEPVKGQQVCGNYFAGLGVTPVAGRLIQPADDVVGAAGVAVISERLATRRLGSAAAAVGQTIRFNDKPFTVIGVVPARFFGAEPGAVPDVYVPMRAEWIFDAAGAARKFPDDHFYWLEIMARLKPGVTIAQAQAALAPRFARFVESTATSDDDRRDLPVLSLEAGATGLDSLRRRYAQPLYILVAMVAMILLIACSNTANLLLSRAAARRREIAVRLSIGASRGRVVRQLLTESVLLSSIGAALGVAIAWWGIRVLTDLLSNGRDNFTLHAELNWSVLGVTIVLAVVTGLLFGLAPALQATRVDVVPALKEVRANAAPRRRRGFALGPTLVVAQIVLSAVLLIGAGLFGRTLAKLHAIETGFDRENVLLFTIRPLALGYQAPQLNQLYENIRLAAGRLPGAERATVSTSPLPMGGGTIAPVSLLGTPIEPGAKPPRAVLGSVGPGFFTTMRIALEGRDFTELDAAGAPKVAVVNRSLAKSLGAANPIGRTLRLGADEFEIVGLADDALSFTLKEERRPAVYFSYLQAPRPSFNMTYEIRTSGDPLGLAAGVRRAVREIDSRLAIHEMKTQAAHIDQAISSEVTLARLCSAFAILALVIACIGLYGTVAFNVARRTNEIGIRMTLGAQRGRIVWMVVRQVLGLTAAGLALGVPLALAGSRYVKALLFGIESNDPVAIGIGVAALVVSCVLAGFIPARRAARIDPLVAVRHD